MTFKSRAQSIVGNKNLSEVSKVEDLVQLAEDLAKSLPSSKKEDSVSSKQVRIMLTESVAATSRIQRGQTIGSSGDADKDAAKEATLLRISLVYAAARERNNATVQSKLADYKECFEALIQNVKTFEDFKMLRKFSEAVMAYFKFHGGK